MARIHRIIDLGLYREVEQEVLAGADVNLPGFYKLMPFQIAIQNEFADISRLLIDHGADVNPRVTFGRTPLEYAASLGDVSLVKYLLASGADPNNCSKSTSPLLESAQHLQLAIYELLLAHGANPAVVGRNGKTAAEWIAFGGIVREFDAVRHSVELHFGQHPRPDEIEHVEYCIRIYATPEEFVAHQGRKTRIVKYRHWVFPDTKMHEWVQTVCKVIADESMLHNCELQYLTGEQLELALVKHKTAMKRADRRTRATKRTERGTVPN